MLRLHNENVNKLKLELTEIEYESGNVEKRGVDLKGKEVFEIFCLEIEELFRTVLQFWKDENYSFIAGYAIFFHGKFINSNKDYIEALENIETRQLLNRKLIASYVPQGIIIYKEFVTNYQLIQGHSENYHNIFDICSLQLNL